jgi:head-tail adaptor
MPGGRLVPVTAWPHIDPGKKRHWIKTFAQNATQDSFGQESTALGANPVLGCFAAIETTTTRELFQDGFVSLVSHRITTDWPNVAITADMRVVFHSVLGAGASLCEIQTIENVQERNLVMILTCLEINNQKVGS